MQRCTRFTIQGSSLELVVCVEIEISRQALLLMECFIFDKCFAETNGIFRGQGNI